MNPSLLDQALAAQPVLLSLATVARRRRAARERAAEEFEDGTYVVEDVGEDEPMQLAAADVRVASFGNGSIRVELQSGIATLREGPGGLALRVGRTLVPLQRDIGAEIGLTLLPQSVVVVDARGQKIVLSRKE